MSNFLCLPYTKLRKTFLLKKSFLRESGSEGLTNKGRDVLTTLVTAINKDPTMSLKKHTNELKVNEKSVWTAIKQDFSPDLKPLDYAFWGVLENKTNATPHPNIGLLKTTIEEELNKMSEEFILKARKYFEEVLIN